MKHSILKRVGILCMVAAMSFTAIPVQATEITGITAVQEKTTVRNGWVKENGKYYYYVNGKKLINQLKKIGNYYYYLGSDGARKTGWYTVKKTVSGKTVYRTYYFNSKGASNGKYVTADSKMMQNLDKVISANKISSNLNTVSKEKAAVKKLYDYTVKTYKYRRVIGFQPTKNWHFQYAKEMLARKSGSCYHDAAVFGTMVKRATGLPVRVCWGKATGVLNKGKTQVHAWTEIKIGDVWYVYDTNAGRYSNVSRNWYYRKVSGMTKYYKADKKVEVKL
ncbi:MAG: transglutaminase domain-containing protein [Blautia sp.]|nr:transglutaminase domain-containing protein [Blautia sp.]